MTAQSVKLARGLQTVEVTMPAQTLYHYITDDELAQVSSMPVDPAKDIFLASLGLAGGAVVPAIEAAHKVASSQQPGLSGMLMFALAAASGAAAAISLLLWRRRSKTHSSLLSDIRGRKRVPVQS